MEAPLATDPEESSAEPRDALEHARAVLAGTEALPPRDELESIVGRLEARGQYVAARRLLERAQATSPDAWIVQRLVSLTLRDDDETPARRHARALEMLDALGLRTPAAHPETLRLGALLYEGKWEAEGRIEHLETALAMFLLPWERDPHEDRGRGGTGAARVLDRLAAYARRSERAPAPHADGLAARAREIRWEILTHAPGPESARTPAMLAVAAEAHFGLDDYEKAGEYLARARAAASAEAGVDLRDAFRRLTTVATARGVDLTGKVSSSSAGWRARRALARLAGEAATLRGAPGVLGLALAGGGLRAAFFHLGALARLAETGVLPSVEVLSTVSGGSLVGAQYYLEVRRLLHAKGDDEIEPNDYIEIVQRLIPLFLAAGQSNLRMRTLSDLRANLGAIVSTAQSRSRRLGDLYERALHVHVPDGDAVAPRPLRGLAIEPIGPASRQCADNWRRYGKVPSLIVGATALDPARRWSFTTGWMGEPDGPLRVPYDDAAVPDVKDFRLGWAVAASSCVPSLFEPFAIDEIDSGRSVRLVDGGVDGVGAVTELLDRGCSLLVSVDASAKLTDVPDALAAHLVADALGGLCTVRLDGDVPPSTSGVDRDLQRSLCAIRTDFDVFTEVEAYALMLAGYRMTADELQRGAAGPWASVDVDAASLPSWPFLHLDEIMRLPANAADVRRADLGEQLAMASGTRWRAVRLDPILRAIATAGAVLAIVAFAVAFRRGATITVGTKQVGVGAAAFWTALAIAVFARPVREWLRPHGTRRTAIYEAVLAVGGFIAATIQLNLIDPCLRRRGKIHRLLRLEPAE